jgi:hypothetical protein
MKLVPDWKEGWKWFSVWAMALAASLQVLPELWLVLPQEWKGSINQEYLHWVTIAVLFGGILGRFIDQGNRHVVSSGSEDPGGTP